MQTKMYDRDLIRRKLGYDRDIIRCKLRYNRDKIMNPKIRNYHPIHD